MALTLRSNTLQPVDGDDGWKARNKKPGSRPRVITPTPAPPPIHVDLASLPALMTAKIEQFAASVKDGKLREKDRLQAQLELAKDDARRRDLQMRASGQTPTPSDRAEQDRLIGDLETRIAAVDTAIAVLDRRTRDRVERAPALFATLFTGVEEIVQTIASLQSRYDAMAKADHELQDLLTDVAPSGMVTLSWIPKHPHGDSVLSVRKRLKAIFGKSELLPRLLNEARDAGLNV